MRLLAFLALPTVFVMLASCSDDGLGNSFIPDPIEEFIGPAAVVQPGDKFWYQISHIYRRTTASDKGGMTEGEKQSASSMCIDVTDVRDTETTRYKDAAETIFVADVRVTGRNQIGVYYDDMDEDPDDPDLIDNVLNPLWLKRATFPITEHGYTSPSSMQFHTRQPPVGTDQSLSELPFFDARVSTDGRWGSWDFYNNDCFLYTTQESCPSECKWEFQSCGSYDDNFFNRIYAYFAGALPGPYPEDDPSVLKFKMTSIIGCQEPCAEATTPDACPDTCKWTGGACVDDMSACFSKSCQWIAEECLNLYEFQAIWRDVLPTSVAQRAEWSTTGGAVLHKLKLKYTGDGVLYSAEEYIVPDLTPGSLLPNPVDFTACVAGEACIIALVDLDWPWGDAYCTF